MTSNPASRRALATILAPRSWPSSPGLAMTIRCFSAISVAGNSGTQGLRSEGNYKGDPNSLYSPLDHAFPPHPVPATRSQAVDEDRHGRPRPQTTGAGMGHRPARGGGAPSVGGLDPARANLAAHRLAKGAYASS